MPPRVSLPNLPVEILAEILFYTRSLPTMLAVARTCSFLYHSLARNADASFIWRAVRRASKPRALPDPGEGWGGSEADYAAFVFGGGVCEVCERRTREMYVSFAARIRICGSWHCRSRYLEEHLVNVTTELGPLDRRLLWVPPLESTRCFYPNRVGALMWPQGEVMLRKRDWDAFRRDLQAYEDAVKADADGSGNEGTRGVVERSRAALERLPRVMVVSERLVRWKWDYDHAYKEVKKRNSRWTTILAEREGWVLEDLVATHTFGSLERCKNLHLETIELKDVIAVRSTIESELLSLKARHQRQEAEGAYRAKLTEIKKLYERMRCGTLDTSGAGGSEPSILPPLSVFYTLPSVRVLKGSPDPNAGSSSAASDMDSPLAVTLVKQDVRMWLAPTEKRLMALLGHANGWQSASTRTVHPLRRVTARFFCRRCGEGKVGRAYQRERCLDFKGVCSHVCRTKGGGKTPEWTVDVFDKDDKAIALIKTVIRETGLAEDKTAIDLGMNALDAGIRCKTCPGWVMMDFETAIGHAHRHETMRIELAKFVPRVDGMEGSPTFERGNAELLLGPSLRAKNLCKQVNYGCRHCIERDGGKGRPRAMSFHGLRSHVKAKHGVEDIWDEDFFCYTSIRKGNT